MKFSLYLIPKLSPRIKLPRASTFLPSIMYLLCVAERFGKMFFHAFPASHGHYRCVDVKATCPLCIKQNVKLEKKATSSPYRMAQGKDMYYNRKNIFCLPCSVLTISWWQKCMCTCVGKDSECFCSSCRVGVTRSRSCSITIRAADRTICGI